MRETLSGAPRRESLAITPNRTLPATHVGESVNVRRE